MANGLGTISALTLFVDDLAASKEFYSQVFDASLVYSDDASAVFAFEGLLINLLAASEAPELIAPDVVAPASAGSRAQLSIWVDSVDAVHQRLVNGGVTGITGPIDRPWGKRTLNFSDPAGHCWEIAQDVATEGQD